MFYINKMDYKFYTQYELQLIQTIMKYYNMKNNDSKNLFFTEQIAILKNRLKNVQILISNFERNEDEDVDNGHQILVDFFDHPESNFEDSDKYYSLRSWTEYYLEMSFESSNKLSNRLSKKIEELYINNYNVSPTKICIEEIDGVEQKVNSYNQNEFDCIIKPYLDDFFECEATT